MKFCPSRQLKSRAIKEEIMSTKDKCCTIVPYFKVPSKNLQAFKKLCEAFVEKSSSEPKCLYYGFTFDGDQVHCREGYADADGLLTHLKNVDALLKEALKIAELAKLRDPLADFKPQFFTLEYGFRR
jgi:quinol monooxygenase YgiN